MEREWKSGYLTHTRLRIIRPRSYLIPVVTGEKPDYRGRKGAIFLPIAVRDYIKRHGLSNRTFQARGKDITFTVTPKEPARYFTGTGAKQDYFYTPVELLNSPGILRLEVVHNNVICVNGFIIRS